MQYCDRCKLSIKTKHNKCPLCQGELHGKYENGNEVFPELKEINIKYKLFYQYFTFFCICIGVIAIVINVIISPNMWWSIFVLLGIFLIWISMAVGIAKRRNLLKNVLWQLFLISVSSVILDIFTNWHKWSVNYVIPSICVITIILMTAIYFIQHLSMNYNIIYFIIAGLFGMIPMIFIFTGLVNIIYPSTICSGISFLVLAGLFIFQRKILISEIYKKLHL